MQVISNGLKISDPVSKNLEEQITSFNEFFEPLEKNHEYIFVDKRTKAIYFECHIKAKKLIELSTIDVPLDPESQAEYRANRDIVEDHNAYLVMKQDALSCRSFSNIVGEYNVNCLSALLMLQKIVIWRYVRFRKLPKRFSRIS